MATAKNETCTIDGVAFRRVRTRFKCMGCVFHADESHPMWLKCLKAPCHEGLDERGDPMDFLFVPADDPRTDEQIRRELLLSVEKWHYWDVIALLESTTQHCTLQRIAEKLMMHLAAKPHAGEDPWLEEQIKKWR